jgi:hypothetical protein
MIRAALLLLVIPISCLAQAGLSFTSESVSQADIKAEQCGVYSALIQADFVDQFKSMMGTDVSLAVIYNETYDARPIDYPGDYDHELLDEKTLTVCRPELLSRMPGLSRRTIEDFYTRNVEPDSLCDSFDLSVSHVLVSRDELDNLREQDRLAFDDAQDAPGADKVDQDEEMGRAAPDEEPTYLDAFQRKYSGAPGLICLSKAGFNRKMSQALVYVELTCGLVCSRGFFVWLVREDGVWKIRDEMPAWIA